VLLLGQLVTDFELLLPLWYELIAKGDPLLEPHLCVVTEMLAKFPHASNVLRSRCIPFFEAQTEEIIAGSKPDLSPVAAVITATETSLRPHRAAHALAARANEAGIPTYTMQHGFDNIGLTYFDHIQTSALVEFASRTIFTWGPMERLHLEVRPETRARCIPVGCTKQLEAPPSSLGKPGTRARLIAIFENIHWHRYDAAYGARFLDDMEFAARRFQDTTFVVKPHPAGRWLTGRYKGPLPQAENLMIASPGNPEWEDYSASALIYFSDAVITTPSTVALDAARQGRPVAVVAYGLQFKEYDPLFLIRSTQDWCTLVAKARDAGRHDMLSLAEEFLRRSLIPGDATRRIVEHIIADVGLDSAQKADRVLSSTGTQNE
jgi:hypothetical protein